MEVFGVGPFELLLVVLIGFIVLGPERIPGVMRTIGKTIRQLRQMLQTMLTSETGEKLTIPREVLDLQRDLKNLRGEFNEMAQQLVLGPGHPPAALPKSTSAKQNDAPPADSTA